MSDQFDAKTEATYLAIRFAMGDEYRGLLTAISESLTRAEAAGYRRGVEAALAEIDDDGEGRACLNCATSARTNTISARPAWAIER